MFTLPYGITAIIGEVDVPDYYYMYDYVYNSTDHAYVHFDVVQRPWWKTALFWYLTPHGFPAFEYADTVIGLSILINVRVYAEVIFWQIPFAIYRFGRKIVQFIMTNVFRMHSETVNDALNASNDTAPTTGGRRWAYKRTNNNPDNVE